MSQSQMRMHDYVEPSLVRVDLNATDTNAVVRTLVDALVDARVVADGDPIYKHLCKWEPEYGSWACFGHQIAIPHMRTDLVDRLHVAIGVLPQGIDWLAPDDRPVLAAFLFLVPRAQPGEHMRWLKQLHQAIQQFDIMPALARCRTPDEVCELLRQTDQKLLPPG